MIESLFNKQELEPVLEPLRTLDFLGFQEPVLERALNLEKKIKKRFHSRFLGTLNF
jgi:hypothetical protein